jgi:diacylglycerol kinase (ATP)
LYRALWADRDWREVLDDVLAGRARVRLLDLLDVTTAGVTRGATLGASVGLVAEIVARSVGLDGVDGRDRYTTAAFEAIAEHRPFDARVSVDGAVLAAGPQSFIAVGGARHRSGTFELLPRSVLDDGLADVCTIHGLDGDGFVALAGPITAGAHLAEPGVAYGQGRVITVERLDGRPLVLETDGDLWDGAGPSCTVSVRPNAVGVFAPIEPVAG